jgi:aminopeptidase N
MLFDWVGHGPAFKALHTYLKRHAYGNAVTEDLWAALEEESGLPVGRVMRNWTSKPGYPFLYISTTDASSGALHRGSLTLRSARHTPAWAANTDAWPTPSDFADGPSTAAAELAAAAWRVPGSAVDHADWSIPISIVVEGGSSKGAGTAVKVGVLELAKSETGAGDSTPESGVRSALLASAADNIAAEAAAAHSHWVKVNAGHAGFYRTVYDGALLGRLLPALRTPADRASPPALSCIDRLGLVGDVWAGVQTVRSAYYFCTVERHVLLRDRLPLTTCAYAKTHWKCHLVATAVGRYLCC